MPTPTTYENFKCKSTWYGAAAGKSFGLMFIWSSLDDFSWWLHPSFAILPHLIVGTVFGLVTAGAGAMLAVNTCQIEVRDEQLRFRRFLEWQAVPLESINSMRWLRLMGYLRIDHDGKCQRIFFFPAGYEMHWYAHPLAQFLHKVYRRNAEMRVRQRGRAAAL